MSVLKNILKENDTEGEVWYCPPTMVKDGDVHGVVSGVGGKLHRELPGGFETKTYKSIKGKYMSKENSFVSEIFIEGVVQAVKDKAKGEVHKITSQFNPKNMGKYALNRVGQVGGQSLVKHIETKKGEK